jgi:PilZ domain-containing protein
MLSIAPKTPPDAPGPAEGSASAPNENRNSPRYAASAVPAITGLRISPHGVEASLVNISETGVLAECGERLKPGSAVTVVFEGTFVPRSMEGRVARNSVASMGRDGRLRYHVGISFARRLDLGSLELPAPAPEPEPQTAPAPVVPAPIAAAAAEDAAPALAAAVAALVQAATPAEPESAEFDVPLSGDEPVRNRW